MPFILHLQLLIYLLWLFISETTTSTKNNRKFRTPPDFKPQTNVNSNGYLCGDFFTIDNDIWKMILLKFDTDYTLYIIHINVIKIKRKRQWNYKIFTWIFLILGAENRWECKYTAKVSSVVVLFQHLSFVYSSYFHHIAIYTIAFRIQMKKNGIIIL